MLTAAWQRLLGSRPVPPILPERIRAAVRVQEETAEILIGWAQIVVIAFFAGLYALAPKAWDSGMFAPAPWVLAAYALFTLKRLHLAYRRRLAGWVLDLSVVVDVLLLLGLIWSFHIQYQQPAAFYLKAPTLLYAFIFIALRALRFDPRHVVLAGVGAALGWAGLTLYALAAGGPVTHEYVAYMTGSVVLVGAELDKIVAILVVTAILATAVVRVRRLLVVAVAETTAARDLARFLTPDAAQRIQGAEFEYRPGQGEADDAAILIVDLRGFTSLAATLPPDDVVRLLTGYQARMVPAIQSQGGTIDKFLGDGIMAIFRGEAYAARALAAVEAALGAAADWNRERGEPGRPHLAVNAAVATGRIVAGAVGTADRLEFTVIGDAVNTASKLEKHNKDEGTTALATAQAYDLARAQGYIPSAEWLRLPGREVAGRVRDLRGLVAPPPPGRIDPARESAQLA